MTSPVAPALIATLGLQPQVITRSLDRLLEIEPLLGEVVIIHTAAFPKQHSQWPNLLAFKQELAATYPSLNWRWLPILDQHNQPLFDVETPEYAELTFKLIFNQVKELKRQRRTLHGLIAGGRKSMIVYTLISAQMLFDVDDRLWHLFSRVEDESPHVAHPAASRLVEIPILHLAGLMPLVRDLLLFSEDPNLARRIYAGQQEVEKLVRQRSFFEQDCDPTDQKILRLMSKGLSNRQIGEEVGLAEAAVNSRISDLAHHYYRKVDGRPLRPWPKHIRPQLIPDLAPLMEQLEREENKAGSGRS